MYGFHSKLVCLYKQVWLKLTVEDTGLLQYVTILRKLRVRNVLSHSHDDLYNKTFYTSKLI
jgi:hypothetical protein